MFANSPSNIFVCPQNQIGLSEKMTIKLEEYANISNEMVGFSPNVGKVCLAKSKEDDAWYRGACTNFEVFSLTFFFLE